MGKYFLGGQSPAVGPTTDLIMTKNWLIIEQLFSKVLNI